MHLMFRMCCCIILVMPSLSNTDRLYFLSIKRSQIHLWSGCQTECSNLCSDSSKNIPASLYPWSRGGTQGNHTSACWSASGGLQLTTVCTVHVSDCHLLFTGHWWQNRALALNLHTASSQPEARLLLWSCWLTLHVADCSVQGGKIPGAGEQCCWEAWRWQVQWFCCIL